jgi:hypothetical protein
MTLYGLHYKTPVNTTPLTREGRTPSQEGLASVSRQSEPRSPARFEVTIERAAPPLDPRDPGTTETAKRQIAGELAGDQNDPMGTPSFLMPKCWKTPILIASVSTQVRLVAFQARLHIRLYSIVSLMNVTDPSQKRKLAPPGW